MTAHRPPPAPADRGATASASERSTIRRVGAAVTLIAAVVLHASLIINGGSDPHKRFGFRPFAESDTWQAEIVRVTSSGERLAIDDGTWPYEWNDLIGAVELRSPWRIRHANGGARTTVDLLDRALDWLVENTPDDPMTVRYEARVTVVHNAGPPYEIELIGAEREASR
jgi:hypothetical protein